MTPDPSILPSPDLPDDVASAFDALPADARTTLHAVRDIVFATAAGTDGVGDLTESLKWGQPSYAPARPRTGTPVRLGLSRDDRPALFVHCQTDLIDAFRRLYADAFDFEGNRALVLKPGTLPRAALRHCIAMALTYHMRSR